jgi:DeoR family transcriptional regulator of aga operon/DeoR family fructose operon transcriptional repressor
MSLVGEFASAVLGSTQIGKGFFGARGISLERGLMDLNPEEVRFKRELAEACEHVVGVFDHTKWERSALLSFAPAERVDTIVTDERAPAELLQQWRERNVKVVAAPIGAGAPPETKEVPDTILSA